MSIYLLMGAQHGEACDAAAKYFERRRIDRWCQSGKGDFPFFQIFSKVPPFFPENGQFGSYAEFFGDTFRQMSKYDLDEKIKAVRELGVGGQIGLAGVENCLCFLDGDVPVLGVGVSKSGIGDFAREISQKGRIAAYSTMQNNNGGAAKPARRPDIEYLLLGEPARFGMIEVPVSPAQEFYTPCSMACKPHVAAKTWVSETDEDGKPCGWSSNAAAAANGVDVSQFTDSRFDGL